MKPILKLWMGIKNQLLIVIQANGKIKIDILDIAISNYLKLSDDYIKKNQNFVKECIKALKTK